MLIPASKPNAHLCKVMLSAGVLGYPTPALINWGMEFHDKSLSSGGSHIAKIAGIQHYLESITSGQNDDLVLVVDGYDTVRAHAHSSCLNQELIFHEVVPTQATNVA